MPNVTQVSGLSKLYCSKMLSQPFEHFQNFRTLIINFPDNKSIDARKNIFNSNVAIFGYAYSSPSETLYFHIQNRADRNKYYSYNINSTRENSSSITLLSILFPFPHVCVQSSSSVAFDMTTKRINRRLSCDCIHCVLTVSVPSTLILVLSVDSLCPSHAVCLSENHFRSLLW